MNKYEQLVRDIREAMSYAEQDVTRYRYQLMDEPCASVGRFLSWHPDDVMTASAVLVLLQSAAQFLANRTQAELVSIRPIDEDQIARDVTVELARECLSTIMRGEDESTSPASNLYSKCRIKAARNVYQYVCHMGYEPDLHDVRAMVDARNAREQAEQEALDAKPVKVVLTKPTKLGVLAKPTKLANVAKPTYYMVTKDRLDRNVAYRSSGCTNKTDALRAALAWATELGISHACIEFV